MCGSENEELYSGSQKDPTLIRFRVLSEETQLLHFSLANFLFALDLTRDKNGSTQRRTEPTNFESEFAELR